MTLLNMVFLIDSPRGSEIDKLDLVLKNRANIRLFLTYYFTHIISFSLFTINTQIDILMKFFDLNVVDVIKDHFFCTSFNLFYSQIK